MFSPRTEVRITNWIHVIAFALIQGIMGIALYKAFGIKPTGLRNSRWALSISAKSMMILMYEVLSEHVSALHRIYSLKAFLVLNVIEVAFWIAAIVLTVMSMIKSCVGISCTLNGVIIGLAAVLAIIDVPVALISIKQWLFVRRHGYHPYEGHFTRSGEHGAHAMSKLRTTSDHSSLQEDGKAHLAVHTNIRPAA